VYETTNGVDEYSILVQGEEHAHLETSTRVIKLGGDDGHVGKQEWCAAKRCEWMQLC